MLRKIAPTLLLVIFFLGLTAFDKTRTRAFPTYQCTWYVANRRPDVWYWLPETGADAAKWTTFAEQKSIPLDRASEQGFSVYNVQKGDILVLTNGYDGANKILGHVAYVESVDYINSKVHISEYFNRVYQERDLDVTPIRFMSFIHVPVGEK